MYRHTPDDANGRAATFVVPFGSLFIRKRPLYSRKLTRASFAENNYRHYTYRGNKPAILVGLALLLLLLLRVFSLLTCCCSNKKYISTAQ